MTAESGATEQEPDSQPVRFSNSNFKTLPSNQKMRKKATTPSQKAGIIGCGSAILIKTSTKSTGN